MQDSVPVPEETQRLLGLLDKHWNECMLRVGELEERYLNDKDRLFAALRTIQQERQKLLNSVGRDSSFKSV